MPTQHAAKIEVVIPAVVPAVMPAVMLAGVICNSRCFMQDNMDAKAATLPADKRARKQARE